MASGRPWCRHGRRCFSGMRTAATRSGSRRADASRPVDSGGDRQPDLCRAGARSHGDGRAVEVESCDAVPERHGYSLSDNRGRAALARIAEHGVPVVLTQHGAERRQRHAWDRTEDPTMNARLAAARAHPGLRFALNNWVGLGGHKRREPGLKGRGGSTLRGRRGCCAGGVRAERGARGRSGRVWFARAVRRRRSGAREIGEPGAVAGGRFRADCVAECRGFFGIEA